jgi:hypothetical protein
MLAGESSQDPLPSAPFKPAHPLTLNYVLGLTPARDLLDKARPVAYWDGAGETTGDRDRRGRRDGLSVGLLGGWEVDIILRYRSCGVSAYMRETERLARGKVDIIYPSSD